MSGGPAPLSARDFERFRRLAYAYCGLNLEPGKESLVAARLSKVMGQLDIASFGQYYEHVVADPSSGALIEMIDRLTTNHTSFFREPRHFDFLRSTVLPQLAGRARIDLWSAACSSGEEPYSFVIAILEELGGNAPELQLLASDISTRMLRAAAGGVYDQSRLRDLPLALQRRYFLKGHGGSEGLYRVKPAVRARVRFVRVNLKESFPAAVGIYPLILCRNVMIYFDPPTQQALIERLYQRLEPGGYLLIGHAESLNTIAHPFEYVRPATYRKPGRLWNGR
jgi:chemotaxis protein methyltransferase CheR